MNAEDVWVYHERQESALCGQHCLNNLLQNAYFTAPDLSDIALELDGALSYLFYMNPCLVDM